MSQRGAPSIAGTTLGKGTVVVSYAFQSFEFSLNVFLGSNHSLLSLLSEASLVQLPNHMLLPPCYLY
jgi:hypothetical protein